MAYTTCVPLVDASWTGPRAAEALPYCPLSPADLLPHTSASPHPPVSQDRGVKAVLDKARNLLRDNAGSLDNSRTIDSLAMTESSIKKVHVGG